MSGKKVLCVLTSTVQYPNGEPTGWFAPELIHPYNVFKKAGFDITIASILGSAQCDPSSQLDEECSAFLADATLAKLAATAPKLESFAADQFDAILFVGGFGVMWDFPTSTAAQALIRSTYESGKIVAGVCHGPIVFGGVTLSNGKPLVEGKRVTAFTNGEENTVGKYAVVSPPSGPGSCEDVLSRLGATFVDGGVFQANVTVDGNLLCGQNPPSAAPLAEAIVAALQKN